MTRFEHIRGSRGEPSIRRWRAFLVWSPASGEGKLEQGEVVKINVAGATAVGQISLNPSNPGNFSRLTNGRITGDLNGPLVLQESTAGAGGNCTFHVEGNAKGKITAPVIDSLVIDGTLSGAIDTARIAHNGGIAVKGDLSGDITITEVIEESGTLAVWQDVTAKASVTIANMEVGVLVGMNDLSGNFAGDLVLERGIPGGNTVDIKGSLTQTGSIDLNGAGVAENAELFLDRGGSGVIVNGGPVGGLVILSLGAGAFAGTATFSSIVTGVWADGYIGESSAGGLSGRIVVTGNMEGGDIHVYNNVLGTGSIEIGGNCAGFIETELALIGDVSIGGDATLYCNVRVDGLWGAITVGGDMLGMIESTGPVTGGRIVVAGLCDGPVQLLQETVKTSIVHLQGGLGANGKLLIDGNADGGVLVGPAKIPLVLDPVTFDGCIRIHEVGVLGGDLNGNIDVVGCHATPDDLNICIDGAVNGAVNIIQTNCPKQVAWSCTGPCP